MIDASARLDKSELEITKFDIFLKAFFNLFDILCLRLIFLDEHYLRHALKHLLCINLFSLNHQPLDDFSLLREFPDDLNGTFNFFLGFVIDQSV